MSEISEPITLSKPVPRKGGDITSIQVRKPYGGELRGLEMSAVIRGQYDQTCVCLSRCTVPTIHVHELQKLDPFDMGALSGTLSGFFLTAPTPETPAPPLDLPSTE